MAKTIRYESKNGYRGTLEGTELTVIDAKSRLKFHTYASNCRTQKDLKQFVDDLVEQEILASCPRMSIIFKMKVGFFPRRNVKQVEKFVKRVPLCATLRRLNMISMEFF